MPHKDREARRAYRKARYLKHRDRILAEAAQYYRKNLEARRAYNAAYYVENKETILEQVHSYRLEHLEEERERNRQYQETHKDEIRQQRAKYREEHKEEIATKNQKYYETNKEIIQTKSAIARVRFLERNKKQQAKWRKNFPEKRALAHHRRRARKRALPDTWTLEQQQFMLTYWHNACAVCGNAAGFFWSLAFDHFIPLSSPNCPGTVATNMIPLCHGSGGCNNSKRASDPHTWLLRRFGPKKAAKIEKAIATYFAIVAKRFPETSLHHPVDQERLPL